eukprot:NODE_2179_length_1181_cov_31.530919_g1806_i0.p1 GENE.NODE_2179_length_1181_cov_31.530919_g1806_i0~~NODE_2179_length_1181_cov_31.530919_g1806_i0.p1  ORF type:complete len:372 (+),score=99.20 NODE_2179_length_1181_cov_31.530919_g1806_i0:84-1118(+)
MRFADDVLSVRESNKEVIVVSSGAVSQGMGLLNLQKRKPGTSFHQLLAAVGQPACFNEWVRAFYPTIAGQFLVSKDDVIDPIRFISARRVLNCMLAEGVVPVGNENDTITVDEIKIGDNDSLSAMVAKIGAADLLVILTQTDGFFTGNPEEDPKAELIPEVTEEELAAKEHMAKGASNDGVGTGGFATKLVAARMAMSAGIPTIIANGQTKGMLRSLLIDHKPHGTLFIPTGWKKGSTHQRWLADTWPVDGLLVVKADNVDRIRDSGVIELQDVDDCHGDFAKGAVILVNDSDGQYLARALAGYSSKTLRIYQGKTSQELLSILGPKVWDGPVVHEGDLLLWNS